MNNRPDSNRSDFEGRLGGTGKNAGSNKGDQFVKGEPRRNIAKSMHDKSPRQTGKSNRA